MGDINLNKPMERQQITKIEDMTDDTEEEKAGGASQADITGGPKNTGIQSGGDLAANAQEIDNII